MHTYYGAVTQTSRKLTLELQNEELRQSQLQLANEHDRYLELYEHAPVTLCGLPSVNNKPAQIKK